MSTPSTSAILRAIAWLRRPAPQPKSRARRLGDVAPGIARLGLGGAGPASPLKACAVVAARLGPAGGLLFGAAFTAAAALLEPDRVRDPRDFLVLFIYVALAAAFATGALALL